MVNPTFPNVPLTAFNDGDILTPTLAYISLVPPVFDGQVQYFNHSEKIPDDWLSDDPEMVKDWVYQMVDPFKVSVVSGTTCKHLAGFLILADGSRISVAERTFAVNADGLTYIAYDAEGNFYVGSNPPVVRALLAVTTSNTGIVTSVIDTRFPGYRHVFPKANSIKSFGGVSNVDEVATGSSIYSGYYYFRDFTVPVSTTCQVDQFARIFCSGNVDIQGTIIVNPVNNGAAPNTYYVNTNSQGNMPGSGLGAQGDSYNWALQPFGSGGGIGEIASSVTGAGGTPGGILAGGLANLGDGGGNGGGGLWIEAAGTITVGGGIFADGQDGNPVTGTQDVAIVGNGGGSGGTIILTSLVSIDTAASADFYARGGDGGDSYISPSTAVDWETGGGFGGGGGQVVLMAPVVNTHISTAFELDGGVCSVPQSSTAAWSIVSSSSTEVEYRIPFGSNDIGMANSIAGGNGGISGYRTLDSDLSYNYITLTNGATGIVTINNFVPLG